MRDRLLIALADRSTRHPLRLLGAVLALTLIAAWGMSHLRLEMHFKNLMPETHPMVREFNAIIDHFSTASQIVVAARGEEADLKAFADSLAPRLRRLDAYVSRVDYRMETDFMERYGFLLTRSRDLANSEAMFRDLHPVAWLAAVNDNLERTWVYSADGLSSRERSDEALRALDGIDVLLERQRAALSGGGGDSLAAGVAHRVLLGDPYFISHDKDMLLLLVQPTFSLNEMETLLAGVDAIDSVITATAAAWPGLRAGTTGSMALARDETVAANEDAYVTSLVAFVLILILFIASFRMWVAPVLAGTSLLVGIVWSGGLAALTVGSLNMMTSMFVVILLGLGVDFSIHIIAVYSERRAAGAAPEAAMRETLLKSGKGLITGGLTTAAAFLTLAVSHSAGMREFGIVAGSGVICCMAATLVVLPALLALRDRGLRRLRGNRHRPRSTDFAVLGGLAEWLAGRYPLALAAAGIVTGLLFWSATTITFDYNYLNMEPVGLTSVILQHEMEEEFDITPDVALVTATSVDDARHLVESARDIGMVGMVTGISDYLPADTAQSARAPIIRRIAAHLDAAPVPAALAPGDIPGLTAQLERLEANIIEMAQLAYLAGQRKVDAQCTDMVGDLADSTAARPLSALVQAVSADSVRSAARLAPFWRRFAAEFRALARGMTAGRSVTLADLPETILDQYASDTRERFLVTIYPREGVWENLQFLDAFTERMQRLDERVTGIPSIFYVLIDIVAADGRRAALLTIGVVFLLLWLDFGRLRAALLALLPLLTGAVWMLGLMPLFGLQLTLLNVMGVPLILGIGIDDGVHLVHRWHAEGRGSIPTVFTSTGRAVLLTSLTTMLAFGSLFFATYRGLGSLGTALFIGVGCCLLTSLIILPAMFGWLSARRNETERSVHVPAKD